MLYVLSLLVSFAGVFLKGFQHKNVIGGHLRLLFITSYLMAIFDVAAVTLIVKGGWWVAVSSGTGAAFGMLSAVLLHDRWFKAVKT
jgi:hypothetical protein